MTAVKRDRWCWSRGVRSIEGLFETEDAAMEYARQRVREGAYPHMLLKHIEDPDPGDFFGMLHYFDAALADANYMADLKGYREGKGKYFRLRNADRDAAFRDLHEVIAEWARRWLRPCRMIARFVREVDLEEEVIKETR